MEQLNVLLILISCFSFVGAAFYWIKYRSARNQLRSRLILLQDIHDSNNQMKQGNWKQQLLKLADKTSFLGNHFLFPDSMEELHGWLERSGAVAAISMERFLGVKVILTVIGLITGFIGFLAGFPFFQFALLLLPLTGFFTPVVWVRSKASRRQEQISRDMPDFLDVMSLTLQTGVSLDYALQHTTTMFGGPLTEEFIRLKREISLGLEQTEAWQRLLLRNSSPDLHRLANSVLQSRMLGTSIAAIFRLQADDLRRIRMERIKEHAAKASPKITIVTTMLMAPSVFLLILALLIMNVIYNPEGFGLDLLMN